jgi:hypothetical protein
MSLDEPFPLEAVPSRVGYALLLEFKGRCPSLREVDQIPDKHWLTMPGMGPASLKMVRNIIEAQAPQTPSHAATDNLSDAEVLRRLEQLQEDLHRLEAHIRRRLHGQRPKQTSRNDAGNSGHRSDSAEAANHRSDEATSPEGSQMTRR